MFDVRLYQVCCVRHGDLYSISALSHGLIDERMGKELVMAATSPPMGLGTSQTCAQASTAESQTSRDMAAAKHFRLKADSEILVGETIIAEERWSELILGTYCLYTGYHSMIARPSLGQLVTRDVRVSITYFPLHKPYSNFSMLGVLINAAFQCSA